MDYVLITAEPDIILILQPILVFNVSPDALLAIMETNVTLAKMDSS